MTVKCPNCGGSADDHTNDQGGGAVYCSDCGYEAEIPAGTRPKRQPERKQPKPKKK